MNQSPDIKELIVALVKAQAKIVPAPQDRSNPFFNSKYATLNSVMEVVKSPLLENGLTVSQWLDQSDKGVVLTTLLLHTSGQFISSSMPLITTKNDMQSLGSAVSYARRYSIAAIVGVVSEDDDDAEKATSRTQAAPKAAKPGQFDPPLEDLGSYKVTFGKFKGQMFKELDIYELASYFSFIENQAKDQAKPIQGQVALFMTAAAKFLNTRLPTDSALDVIGK